ncbi:MAG: FkbM family methyltransferase, partial [Clostridia bacterium]|nr:FkbM family methyltransferase [Clostridia bacterium]
MPLPYLWQALRAEERPIIIYGMGNGAEKVLDACAQYKIPIAGIFASDDFVRYQTFRGYTVKRYADLIEELGEDLVILIAFSAFTDELLDRIHTLCEKHTVYAPDFDVFTSRYPEADFIESNRAALEQAYALLSDDRSREVFRQLTQYKITGRVEHLFAAHDSRESCLPLLRLGTEECYLDLGAYRGDTVEEFLKAIDGRFTSVDAFEPDPKNRQKLTEYVDSLPYSNITIHPAAVSSASGTLTFTGKGGRASHLAEEGYEVPTVAIDDLHLSPSYIKM